MSKKNELVETKNEVVAVAESFDSDDWSAFTVEQKDFVWQRVLVQQAMSDSVKAKTAEEGDILNLTTGENYGESVELLPIFKTEQIIVEKYNGKKFEYLRTDEYTGKMPAWNEEINSVRYKNSHQYTFFCLTKDLSIPITISLKGTSNKIGKNLVTMMGTENPALKLPPFGRWIKFFSKDESNKDGDTYKVAAFSTIRRITPEEFEQGKKWFLFFKENAPRVMQEEPIVTQEATSTRF